MKKGLTTVILAVFMTLAAHAQLKFGVKGGVNVADMTFSSDVFQANNNKGYHVGPTLKFSLPIAGLGVDAAVLYSQNTAEILGYANDRHEMTRKSLCVPLNLRYDAGVGGVLSCFVFGGPQLAYNIGNNDFDWKDTSNYSLKRSDFSVNVGFGITVMSHFQVSATYNIACGRTVDITKDAVIDEIADQAKNYSSKSRNNIWQLSAAFYF